MWTSSPKIFNFPIKLRKVPAKNAKTGFDVAVDDAVGHNGGADDHETAFYDQQMPLGQSSLAAISFREKNRKVTE